MRNFILVFLGLLGGAVMTGAASAQTALGDGQALDANLGVGTGGRNPRLGPTADDFRMRNLVVTGDVAAGRGFRDVVGYTAPGDFRGELGSDDLFDFRARSALSQLAYVTATAGDSAFYMGQAMGLIEVRRSGAGIDMDQIGQGVPMSTTMTFFETRLNDLSSARFTQPGALDPAFAGSVLGIAPTEEGRVRMRASETRGVQMIREQHDLSLLGLTLYDQARMIEDALEGLESPQPGRPFVLDENQFRMDPARLDEPSEREVWQARVSLSSDYADLLARVVERIDPRVMPDATTPEEHQALAREGVERVQSFLLGQHLEDPADPEDPTDPGTEPTEFDPLAPVLPDLAEGIPPAPLSAEDVERIDLNLLRHGSQIAELAPDGRTRFAQIIRDAQAHLSAQNYFLAERDFMRALRFQPNHPLATAGLVNAQIGAGLIAGASTSLRVMFIRHPEMIDVRYAEHLLPPRPRLDQIVQTIRSRLDEDERAAGAPGDLGLLLAYIGHQTLQPDLVREGLDLMERPEASDPLATVLRGVWLGEDMRPRMIEELHRDREADHDDHADQDDPPAPPNEVDGGK